jgi:hypothetical protein
MFGRVLQNAEVLCRQRGGDESERVEYHDHGHPGPDQGCGEGVAAVL